MGEDGFKILQRRKLLFPLGAGTISLVQVIIHFLIETQVFSKCLGIKKKQTGAKIFFNQSLMAKKKVHFSFTQLFI